MAYNKLSPYKTKVRGDAKPYLSVEYHSTAIVMAVINTICLDTGGWASVTTKRKMNQAAHQFDLGYSIYQRNFDWFVTTKAGTYPFDQQSFSFDRTTGIPE